jgi:hypothetical protein
MSLVYFYWGRTLDWYTFFPQLQMRQDLADNIGFGDEANEFHLAAPPGAEKWIDFPENRGQKAPFSCCPRAII